MRPTPYTTKSGLQIGCRYERPLVCEMSRDMETLQSGLLRGGPTRLAALRRYSTWNWVTNAVMWTLGVVMYVGAMIAAFIV